uniref:Integrase catalytic domain-containing protein n=1 Tax=Plectus sambesii TaxID=2011161 RepID=A0A914X297_9BILA
MPFLQWLDPDYVQGLFESGICSTVEEARNYICESYPQQKSFTARTLQIYLKDHKISYKKPLSKEELEEQVRIATSEIGGVAGRKAMQGYLRSKGIQASQKRISNAQKIVGQVYFENRRQDAQRQLNPRPYQATCFGYNLHFDQNEKLVEYGIVFVMAVDGKSAFITRASIMPRKNNITIYDQVFAASVEEFGLWDQTIQDCGREFFLSIFIQDYLKDFRVKPNTERSRPPFRQVTSCKNNRVERVWQEVNARVGFPIKFAFVEMEDNKMLNRLDLTHLFATSTVGCSVARVLYQRFIDGWNNRSVPKKLIPAQYILSKGNFILPAGTLPTAAAAAELYRNCDGRLTDESQFGEDPLSASPEKQERRDAMFWEEINTTFGGIENIANHTTNNQYHLLQQAVIKFIEIGLFLASQ